MIPAQRVPAAPAHNGPADLADLAELDLEQLRSQRRLLIDELRGVRHWRRITQAQLDLLMMSLRYPVGSEGSDRGERLERLRERDARMSGYERTLRGDIETVTHLLVEAVTRSAATPDPDPVSAVRAG